MRCFPVLLLTVLALPASASADTQTFGFTGGEQTFTVPANTTTIHVVAVGAPGGQKSAGRGGSVEADVDVTPGEPLFVEVGGAGGVPGGGFNGGAPGNTSSSTGRMGGGGGGATDLRAAPLTSFGSPGTRILVAGGGGGSGGGVVVGGGSGGNGGATNAGGGATDGNGTAAAPNSGGGGGGGGWVGGAGSAIAGGIDGDRRGGAGGTSFASTGAANVKFGTAKAPPTMTLTWTPGTTPTPTPEPSPTPGPDDDSPDGPDAKPKTKLRRHPRHTLRLKRGHKRVSVRFRFASDYIGADFRCKLDHRRERSCDSGIRYRVRRGRHRFRVVAIVNGVRDASPSRFSFRVKKSKRKHHRSPH